MSGPLELLIKNQNIIQGKDVLVTGYIDEPEITNILVPVTNYCHLWLTDYIIFNKITSFTQLNDSIKNYGQFSKTVLNSTNNMRISFSSTPYSANNEPVYNSALIFISKSKTENEQYFKETVLKLQPGNDIYVIGPNDGGIRGFEKTIKQYAPVETFDTARKCRLLHMLCSQELITTVSALSLSKKYELYGNNGKIHFFVTSLPGVYCNDRLDEGTRLLLSYLDHHDLSKCKSILDAGTGSGVIAIYLKKMYPDAVVSGCDINAFALESGQNNSSKANTEVNFFPNDMLENTDRYKLIISAPPFNPGLKDLTTAAKKLISEAEKHLSTNGKLIIVANAFLPYEKMLLSVFNEVKTPTIIGNYKIYEVLKK